MANGYTRQSAGVIVDGNVIHAADLNNEFNAIQSAFNISTGHTHDTSVAGNGGPITSGALSTGTPIRQVSLMAFNGLPNCTYNNGSSGVGATLTANANGALTISGQSVVQNQRILLQGQAAQATNGIYVVTTVGNGSTPWVLTRSTDFNNVNNIFDGVIVYVADDQYYSYSAWQLTVTNPVNVGTDSLPFVATATVNNLTGINVSWKTSQINPMPIAASVYLSAAQGISGSTWTKVNFDTIEFEIPQGGSANTTGTYYDKTTNHRYTPNPLFTTPNANGTLAPTVAGEPGYYKITVSATLAAGTTIGAAVYKNGSPVRQVQIPGPGTVSASAIVHMNGSSDYLEGWAFSSSATNVNGGTGPTPSWMDIQFIGANILYN